MIKKKKKTFPFILDPAPFDIPTPLEIFIITQELLPRHQLKTHTIEQIYLSS